MLRKANNFTHFFGSDHRGDRLQNFYKDHLAVRLYKFVEMAMMLVATARTSIIAATIFSLEVDTPCTFLPFQNQKTTE